MATATIIDGKAKAAELSASISAATAALVERTNTRPGLAVVIVGDDPASHIYVRNKQRTAESCGFNSVRHSLPEDASLHEILALVDSLNTDNAVHGILVQLPLPPHVDEQAVTQSILPGKDVDGFHYQNIGMLTAGHLENAYVPCTPAGCMLMIEDQLGEDLSGLNAVIIGRSNIVGKPMASLLLKANATVTICHSRTNDLPSVARTADILVAAVGRAEMVKADWVKPGAVVVDVGINRVQVKVDGESKNRLVGDVDFASAKAVAGAITPVPGGVGPMTIAMLMMNTLRAAERSHA